MLVSAGIIIIKKIDGIPNYLLLRSHHFWDFPKGKREGEEELIQTALREVREETGITASQLDFDWGFNNIETISYTPDGKIRKKSYYFMAAAADNPKIFLPINPNLGRPEHDEWQWFDYEEVAKRVNERVKKALDWANNKIGG